MSTPTSDAPSASAPLKTPKTRRRRPPTLSLSALKQFMSVAKPYWQGDKKRTAWGLLALLIGLMVFETKLAVMLVDKSGEMTSALAGRDAERFWAAVRTTLYVLAFAVPVYAFYYYMRDAFSNYWRRWLTSRFLDGYLGERKYYEIGARGDIDNPDQRISEDINTFTGRSTHFLLIFIGSLMQLVAFSAVLWSISHTLVAILALYAFLGTFGALYFFGTPLIRMNFWQLRREADFRFSLMRLRACPVGRSERHRRCGNHRRTRRVTHHSHARGRHLGHRGADPVHARLWPQIGAGLVAATGAGRCAADHRPQRLR